MPVALDRDVVDVEDVFRRNQLHQDAGIEAQRGVFQARIGFGVLNKAGSVLERGVGRADNGRPELRHVATVVKIGIAVCEIELQVRVQV